MPKGSKVYPLQVDSAATIHDVNKKLLSGRKYVRDSNKLIFKMQILDPSRPLHDQGTKSDDIIHELDWKQTNFDDELCYDYV